MSDTRSDQAGQEEPAAYTPSGLRRSTFTPAPADAETPAFFDDDALAAAMEEEVRPYTSPITLPVLESETGPDPAPAPIEPEPDHIAVDPFTEPPVDDEQLMHDLQGVSTVDAMRRLEDELQRRAATGSAPAVAPGPAFFEGRPPVSPPAPGPDPAPVAELESPLRESASEPLAARLLPPPTDLPDVSLRAELPPPPGYAEDGTITTAAEQASAPATPAEGWDHLLAGAPTPTAQTVTTHPDLAAPPADVEHDGLADTGASDLAPVPGAEPAPPPGPAPDAPAMAIPAPQSRIPPALLVEAVGAEPTPLEQRAGRAARLFWLWFAANASVVSVALGAILLGMGMSLSQAVVATVIGIALSFIPLGFGTLAGKWSGQPTLIVSRAVFGVTGNVVPAILAVLVRVFWGGVLLWLLADAIGRVLVGARADGGLGATVWALVGLGAGIVLTALVAVLGYGMLARVQLVLSIAAALVVVGAASITLPSVRLDVARTHPNGSWLLVAGGAVLVFSFIGLVWAQSGGDLARYQHPGASGGSSMLWSSFGATVPPFLLVVWGALLAASSPKLAAGLAAQPLATIAGLMPSWYPVPLLIAAAIGLLSGSVLTLYSGGFAVQSLVRRLPRAGGVLIAAALALAVGAGLVLLGEGTGTIVRDLAGTLAVPVAAWIGIFAAEMMIRQRRFHAPSLLAGGGIYAAVRWTNLVGLIVISALGTGFVVAGQHWLGWEGWGWRLLGISASDPLAAADLGVVGALVLGILLPIATATPAIRRQESAESPDLD